ncbi:hypothetical protein EGI22_05515 [Lacihabitans sp. LS3-19]|uniref:hypothetical protein n=1 Tax=Lacihabitans sp. LS3-19 TaxID=2487335 RepID=UPI0020CB956D|nr:hypothetical protein [Lacihabitans sp. LS3-19]MCP9767359.1 hypothetical protein [Lacihabitans sp. LS3-19]
MSQENHLESFAFPISFKFNIGTFHNDFTATDVSGNVIAYVKQKLFKLKEEINVFTDESMETLKYQIKADKWLDFNTTYKFLYPDGSSLGRVCRKGWRSIWKASYELYDENDQQDLHIQEKNPWTKVFDSLLGEIPVLGILTGYMFNPSYEITRPDGTLVCTFKKDSSFFGRKFTLSQDSDFEPGEEERVKLGVMMMALLERRRG